MRKVYVAVASMVAATTFSVAAVAKVEGKPPVTVKGEFGVPVFADDLKGRKYVVIGEVKAGVRKATIFSKQSSQRKVYRELWERAEKMGADAVINARFGNAHVTVMSWGQTNATGTAIKFKK
jgi:uncharacterized protein YbjQ (UPF0145 family)